MTIVKNVLFYAIILIAKHSTTKKVNFYVTNNRLFSCFDNDINNFIMILLLLTTNNLND